MRPPKRARHFGASRPAASASGRSLTPMASASTSETGATDAARRGPGRPPDLEKRQAIIDATLDVLAEVGYGVADHRRRRQAGRFEPGPDLPGVGLQGRCWSATRCSAWPPNLALPDTGSTRADLRDFIAQHVDHMRLPAYVKGVPGLTVELLGDRGCSATPGSSYIKPTEDGFATILERGRERGEVRSSAEPWVLTRVVSGITTGLAQTSRLSGAAITEVVLEAVLGGLVDLADPRTESGRESVDRIR